MIHEAWGRLMAIDRTFLQSSAKDMQRTDLRKNAPTHERESKRKALTRTVECDWQ